MGIIFKANGREVGIEPAGGGNWSREQVLAAIGAGVGGRFGIVRVPGGRGKGMTRELFYNEDAGGLPLNEQATQLFWEYLRRAVAGDVLVVDRSQIGAIAEPVGLGGQL